MRNFDFLQGKKNFISFSGACIEAEKSMVVSPSTCAILTRRALELAVKWLYSFDKDLIVPYQDNISSLIHSNSFISLVDMRMIKRLKYIINLGNVAVHTNSMIKRDEAILSLQHLYEFISWIDYCYSDEYTATEFKEELIQFGEEVRVKSEELKDLYEKLSAKDKKIKDVIEKNKELREELTAKRKAVSIDYNFNVDEISEAETRKRYIDVELKLAGWEIGKDVGVEVSVQGMPNDSGNGAVDYVLYGNNGLPLAVVEAKRVNRQAEVANHQAKLYADCLEKKYGQRPVIFFTNGFDIYILDDYEGYPKRRIYGFYKKSELQMMIDRRRSKISLKSIQINDDISNRYYQKEAITAICEEFENMKRKALLVSATGSGKTRTVISLTDVLLRHNWIKNILFLADRKALVKQAKKNFTKLLPNLSACNLLEDKENPEESRIIFSTYPTMLNAIDETKSKDGKRLFTPGHFDLVIVDESHRSVYKKYGMIFDYFDAFLVGLTATPKEDLDKNTYSIFDLENGVPTYAYEYKKAVEDGYLVDCSTIEYTTKLMSEGIVYDDLSEEDKEQYEETFAEDETIGDKIANSAINEWLFNNDTIDLVLRNLMQEGLKVEGGDKLGKTIIFAKNTKHAEAIVKRFGVLYPHLGEDFAKVVDYSVEYVDSIIDDFSDKDKMPQIAISVDMLDTGIDIPEILNLVYFKKVRSKTKFWQMLGRGTRLCPDLLGIGKDKEKFLIFDYCGNCAFFRLDSKPREDKLPKSLTEKLYNVKLNIVRELQDLKYSENKYVNLRKNMVEDLINKINMLDEDSFVVKMVLYVVHKYKNKEMWKTLGTNELSELKENISPIIIPSKDDEISKRFDLVMFNIQLAYLQGTSATRGIRVIMATAEELSKLGTIPQVKEKSEMIERVLEEEFWEEADIFELEEVRESLRNLVKYLEKKKQIIYTTDFDDLIVAEERKDEMSSGAMVNNLKNYKKKVEHYLNEHKDELAIYKLRNNKKLTKTDIDTLEEILFNQLGTVDDYRKEYGDTPITHLVKKIVGMDRATVNEIFSKFLNEQSFNTKQINFVKLIIEYIVKNGFIEDNKILMHEPFRNVGSIVELFQDKLDERAELIKIINQIRDNSSDVS